MIRLTCANCQAQLEVDDAFAGGVCRCKHCKAIQTVPKRGQAATAGHAIAGKTAGGEEPRTLYQVKSRAGLASTPSGLEELAEAVHGSGLTGSGLLNRPVPRGPAAPAPPKSLGRRPNGLVIGLAAAAVLVLIAVVVYLATRTPSGGVQGQAGQAVAGRSPTFAGVPLAGNKVVYVLDRGDATVGFFSGLRDLTVSSVRSLGPDRLFQVVLWDNGSPDAYPNLTTGYATAEEADKLSRWFDRVATGRSTDVLPSLRMALVNKPDTVVLATGKSLQLDGSFADGVLALRPPQTIFHAFTLGETAPDDPMRTIARAAGGRFEALAGPELTPSGQ